MPWLVFAQPYDPAIAGLRSVYLSDTGFTTEPGETPANTYWDRRVEVPLVLTESLYGGGFIGGRSEISAGAIVLANGDGGLDALDGYEWDGRLVEIRYSALPDPALADFQVVWSGTADQFLLDDAARIELRDLQALLDVPYQPITYAGTGAAEGGADLAGRRKPRCLGRARGFEPVAVDPANLVYQVHDGAVNAISDVRDRGIFLGAPVTDHPSYAALIGATIAAGTYHTCLAQGLFRLGAAPVGVLTVNTCEGARPGAWLSRVGELIQHAVEHATDLAASDFQAGTVAAIDTLCPNILGHWYSGEQETTLAEVLDALAGSVGVTYGFNATRKLVLSRFEAPATTPDHVFGERDLIELRPQPAPRRTKTVTLGWQRYYRPLAPEELASAVPAGERTRLTSEWLLRSASSSAAATESLLAREERTDTLLWGPGSGVGATVQAEANRRRDLFSPRRKAFVAVVPYDAAVRVGQTVELRDPRFGLASGRRMRLLRIVRDAAAGQMTMELWG